MAFSFPSRWLSTLSSLTLGAAPGGAVSSYNLSSQTAPPRFLMRVRGKKMVEVIVHQQNVQHCRKVTLLFENAQRIE